MDIEQTIVHEGLPVNSIAMLTRLQELLEENKTNSFEGMICDHKIKGVMWLLNAQVFGQCACIDMVTLWEELNAKFSD